MLRGSRAASGRSQGPFFQVRAFQSEPRWRAPTPPPAGRAGSRSRARAVAGRRCPGRVHDCVPARTAILRNFFPHDSGCPRRLRSDDGATRARSAHMRHRLGWSVCAWGNPVVLHEGIRPHRRRGSHLLVFLELISIQSHSNIYTIALR